MIGPVVGKALLDIGCGNGGRPASAGEHTADASPQTR
jgi:cyclopropane fatty-acyl-phospholipid synthase-like methyltransferase